jgi:hypothetical protein
MLEEMEEVFKVDNLSYICGCFPTYRYPVYSSSLISGSAATNNYSSMGSTTPYSMFEPHHADSNGEIITTIDDPDTTLYEPRSLHKYSRDMKEGMFSYYQKPTTTEKKKKSSKQVSTPDRNDLQFKSPEKILRGYHPGSVGVGTAISGRKSSTGKAKLFSEDHSDTPKYQSATYMDLMSPPHKEERGIIEDDDNELSSFLPKSKVSFFPEPSSFERKGILSNIPSESSAMQTKSINSTLNGNNNGSKQNSLSSLGNTFYESLFSGRKQNEINSNSTSKNPLQQSHQKNSAKKVRLDEENQFQHEDEESYEPLIESYVVRLPFHDK